MERTKKMQRKLHEAAVEGSVASLLRLLKEDTLALDRYIAACFPETSLHIAAMLGHLEFTAKIPSRKHQFAKELDFRRSSPPHLATANRHLEVVNTFYWSTLTCALLKIGMAATLFILQ